MSLVAAQTPNTARPNGLCGSVLALLRFVTQRLAETLGKPLGQLLKVRGRPRTRRASEACGLRVREEDACFCQTLPRSWASVFKAMPWG